MGRGRGLLFACLLFVGPALASSDPVEGTSTDAGPVTDAAEVLAPDPAPAEAGPLPNADHPDLLEGSFGVFLADEKATPFNTAMIGIIDGRLHVIAARWEGGIFNPAMDMRFDIALEDIVGIGLKKYGFNRQLHIDLGDRKLALHFSGKSAFFYDTKAAQAYYERLVAAGVPVFKPRRFIHHPPRTPIYIHY